jgi:hypothetical protein
MVSRDLTANPYLRLIETIAHQVRVVSPTRFRHSPTGLHAVPRGAGDAESSEALTDAVAGLLYTSYYLADPRAPDARNPRTDAPMLIDAWEQPAFGRQLREANLGDGYLEHGWSVSGDPSTWPEGAVLVRRGGLTLAPRRDQVAPVDGTAISPGASVSVRFPKDRPYSMAGFYVAIGRAGPTRGKSELVRWYFHLLPEGAPRLLRRLTSATTGLTVPFTLKLQNHPERYTRPDAAVLYLARSTFAQTLPAVLAAQAEVADALRPRVPAFARAVRPGLGLAEEPLGEGRMSFGQHRCRLIARGLVAAAAQGRNSAAGRQDAVLAAFAEEGISLDAPHLNPGSAEFDLGPGIGEMAHTAGCTTEG